MGKTKIEWCDYTINPIKGLCRMGCTWCYARRLYRRFKWSPDIKLDMSVFDEIRKLKRSSRVFVCSTHELFGDWIPDEWIESVLMVIKECSHHVFQILTKNPVRATEFEFPSNCWVGVSVDTRKACVRMDTLKRRINAEVKFVSFEPLLEDLELTCGMLEGLNWVIIGGLSGERNKEKIRRRQVWAERIMEKADALQIPVFVKDNLHFPNPRREFPR